jgi:hypothetical protein
LELFSDWSVFSLNENRQISLISGDFIEGTTLNIDTNKKIIMEVKRAKIFKSKCVIN